MSATSSRTCWAIIRLFQVHAADYTNPGQLPRGAVLVAGAGASGAQIAEELLQPAAASTSRSDGTAACRAATAAAT